MTKQEYLNELQRRLSSYPKDYQQDMLDAFEDHFQEGLLQGKSEAEVMEELGPIDDVMDNIKMLYDEPQPHKEDHSAEAMKDLTNNLNDLSSSISKTVKSAADVVKENVSSGRWSSFDADQEETGETIQVENGSAYQAVVVQSADASLDVELIPSDHFAYQFSDRISIFSPKHAELRTAFNDQAAGFVVRNGSAKLKLWLPQTVAYVDNEAYSGDFSSDGITLDRLKVNQTSGDVDLDSVKIKDLQLKTVGGDINIDDGIFETGSLQTTSGDIDADGIAGQVSLKTVSGDIKFSQNDNASVQAETISGDIDLDVRTDTVAATSFSGEISIDQTGKVRAIKASTVSGDIECTLDDQDYTAELTTKTGDLNNETGLSERELMKNSLLVGNGSGHVVLSSKSGDIELS
jgi:hypothetical protein